MLANWDESGVVRIGIGLMRGSSGEFGERGREHRLIMWPEEFKLDRKAPRIEAIQHPPIIHKWG